MSYRRHSTRYSFQSALLASAPEPPRRRRRRRRLGAPAAALAAAGLVLIAGGTLALVRAGTRTADHAMAGGATAVPATVQTTMPTAPARTAAQLKPSEPERIIIPSLHVNAPIMLLGTAADGSVQVPPLANHNLAGWYDRSVMPGRDGTSVILGHVDSYSGTSVFYDIRYLTPGQLVRVVRANGSTATFAVDGVREVAKATFPSREIYGNTRYPGLRLITCGGPFDTASRQYLDNIVVYAHLVA